MYGDIFKFVEKQKKRFRTNDPFQIAEALGIVIAYKKFDALKGMYFISERISFIYLNEDMDEQMERAVLFHEIGHHLLHRHLASVSFQEFGLYDMTSKPEMEANIFAANMMISDDDVLDCVEMDYTTSQSASSLSVPHDMFLIKLKDMNDRGYDFHLDYIPQADFLGR